jgi:hypothetical protein
MRLMGRSPWLGRSPPLVRLCQIRLGWVRLWYVQFHYVKL